MQTCALAKWKIQRFIYLCGCSQNIDNVINNNIYKKKTFCTWKKGIRNEREAKSENEEMIKQVPISTISLELQTHIAFERRMRIKKSWHTNAQIENPCEERKKERKNKKNHVFGWMIVIPMICKRISISWKIANEWHQTALSYIVQ